MTPDLVAAHIVMAAYCGNEDARKLLRLIEAGWARLVEKGGLIQIEKTAAGERLCQLTERIRDL